MLLGFTNSRITYVSNRNYFVMDVNLIKENLQKLFCYKCGGSLEGAKMEHISNSPMAHVTCKHCNAESMVTLTLGGIGSVPHVSDLTPKEIKKFLKADPVSYDEVLQLHKLLKRKSIWKLLQQKEQNKVEKLNS